MRKKNVLKISSGGIFMYEGSTKFGFVKKRFAILLCILIFLLSIHKLFPHGDEYHFYHDIEKISSSCSSYEPLIREELDRYPVSIFDVDLICSLIFVESSFNSEAESRWKAVGLMQVTPLAWKDYIDMSGREMKLKERVADDNNIALGIWYLHRIFYSFFFPRADNPTDKELHTVLSAYWMGMSKVKSRAVTSTVYSKKIREVYVALRRYRESRNMIGYVEKTGTLVDYNIWQDSYNLNEAKNTYSCRVLLREDGSSKNELWETNRITYEQTLDIKMAKDKKVVLTGFWKDGKNVLEKITEVFGQ